MNTISPLLILLTIILASTGTNAQFSGTWLLDWQSKESAGCSPASFVVANISNGTNVTYTVTYTFNSKKCPDTITNYTSNLTQNSTTGIYSDSHNILLDVSADAQSIIYTNGSSTFLFDKNGSYFPQQPVFGLVGGTWINATFVNATNGTNSSQCCVPSSLWIYPSEFAIYNEQYDITVTNQYTSNCTTQNWTSIIAKPTISTSIVNWATSNTSYLLDPYSTTNQLTVEYDFPNFTCTYSYKQSTTNVTMINGTWQLDWQSHEVEDFLPDNITVTNVNNSYLTSTLTYSYGGILYSYFVPTGTSPNQYYDPIAQLNYTYDATTNTLLTEPVPLLQPFSILYSQNGSLLPDDLSDSYWNNSQSLDGTPFQATCCIPDFLHIIKKDDNDFYALYNLSSNYSDVSGCKDIIQSVTEDQLTESYLTISNPGLSQVVWNDVYGSNISFANGTTSEIIISGFANNVGCDFKMSLSSEPVPPKPISASWMAMDVKALIVMGVGMMIAYMN